VLPSTPVFFHDLTVLIFRSSQRMSAQRSGLSPCASKRATITPLS
jgi:hypothetical protein